MFTHIVVPLDGSSLAEAALPSVATLARLFKARVTLLHVIERGVSASVHGDRHLTHTEEAEMYLADIAKRTFTPDITVTQHVHQEGVRNVPRAIVAHQQELTPDIIVMCTHGSGGMRDALFGNIAQQVAAFGDLPLLVIHPVPDSPTTPFTLDRLLVPIDAEPEHEHGLEMATQLAQTAGSSIHIVSVVPTAATLSGQQATRQRFLPAATHALLESAEHERSEAIQQRMADLHAQRIPTTAEIRRGDPSAVIVDVAEAFAADLIVLGTHCRIGSDAFWNKSVGATVIRRTQRPLLLVPANAPANA